MKRFLIALAIVSAGVLPVGVNVAFAHGNGGCQGNSCHSDTVTPESPHTTGPPDNPNCPDAPGNGCGNGSGNCDVNPGQGSGGNDNGNGNNDDGCGTTTPTEPPPTSPPPSPTCETDETLCPTETPPPSPTCEETQTCPTETPSPSTTPTEPPPPTSTPSEPPPPPSQSPSPTPPPPPSPECDPHTDPQHCQPWTPTWTPKPPVTQHSGHPGSGELAFTGADVTRPAIALGILLLLGLGALAVVRKLFR